MSSNPTHEELSQWREEARIVLGHGRDDASARVLVLIKTLEKWYDLSGHTDPVKVNDLVQEIASQRNIAMACVDELRAGISNVIEERGSGDFSPLLPKLRKLIEPNFEINKEIND